jgi:glycosyltransferase involved in cell wall biosynthesis
MILKSLGYRAWRLLPPTFRREALFTAMAAVAPRPASPPPMATLPITVAGYFAAPSGLGEAARRLADMLEAAGAQVHRADLTLALRQGVGAGRTPLPLSGVPTGAGTLIMHVNGPMLPWGMAALGRRAVAGKHVIGFWNWELPIMPPDWDRGFRFVHRIWGSSEFVAEAARNSGSEAARGGRRVPVEVVHYPVPVPQPAPLGRDHFGLPAEAFIALSVFDASSSVERKNPLAAIAAHRAAFGDRPDRLLVLKTYQTQQGGPAWRAVLAAAAGAANIRIIDREMSRAEVWALIRAADVLVSLHRSEGVGLALSEAMRLGVAVVATGWSGNMDFMDPESAQLVGFRLVPAQDERGTYSVRGAHWADPDIGQAAAALRLLADAPELRQAMAARGQARVAALTPAACGAHALGLLRGTPG